MGWGAIAAAAGSAIGGVASSAISAKAAKETQKMQIDWERERAKNAHQWEVEDLKNAGLNPILSAGGQGANTSGISAPMPDTTGIQKAGEAIGSALQYSMNKKKNDAEIDKILSDISVQDEQKDLIKAQTLKELATEKLITKQQAETAASAMLKTEQAGKTNAETKQILLNLQTNIEIWKEQLKQAKTKSQRDELERRIHRATWWFELLVDKGTKVMDSFSKATTALAASADAVIPL